jgi:hypothetical protein
MRGKTTPGEGVQALHAAGFGQLATLALRLEVML